MPAEPDPEVIFHTDPTTFADRVDALIRSDPVGCSVLATNLAAAVRRGPPPGSLWILVLDRAEHGDGQDGRDHRRQGDERRGDDEQSHGQGAADNAEVVLAGMFTRQFALWLSPPAVRETAPADVSLRLPAQYNPQYTERLTERAVTALARRLATDPAGPAAALPAVRGVVGSARPFAQAWLRQTGRRFTLRMAQRMYQLNELVEPSGVPGNARPAASRDQDLCVDWMHAFHDEAMPWDPIGDVPRLVEHRISSGGLTLWDDGGRPVAMAGTSTVVAGVARIGPVYTPPARRRHGYGAAVTAAATRAGLGAGAARCMLFTDLANPTSNALYPRLGYRPVGDAVDYAFVD